MSNRLTPETFVTVWQTSESLDEFCKRTGMKRNSAAVRASFYRRKGVALKKMKRMANGGRKPLDVILLNQLISASEETVEDGPAEIVCPELPVC